MPINPRDYWIYGRDDGTWELAVRPLLAFQREGFDWQLAPALLAANQRRNFSVEGATETHDGFRSALTEIVETYPELHDWIISFDGPPIAVDELLAFPRFSWGYWAFFHGTAEAALPTIRQVGLCPRVVTGASVAYGGEAKAGRPDVVYLTSQLGMARFAARDAGRATQSRPVVLAVAGAPADRLVPDEDSHEYDARRSLDRMGSFGVLGCIPPSVLSVAYVLVQGEWRTP